MGELKSRREMMVAWPRVVAMKWIQMGEFGIFFWR